MSFDGALRVRRVGGVECFRFALKTVEDFRGGVYSYSRRSVAQNASGKVPSLGTKRNSGGYGGICSRDDAHAGTSRYSRCTPTLYSRALMLHCMPINGTKATCTEYLTARVPSRIQYI